MKQAHEIKCLFRALFWTTNKLKTPFKLIEIVNIIIVFKVVYVTIVELITE